MPVQTVFKEEFVQRTILEKFIGGKSLREIAREYKTLTHADIQRIVRHGIFPKSCKKRTELHLAALIPTPACPTCGEIHLRRTCPTTAKKRARRAINLVDPVSAAATILNHADAAYIARLVELLKACAEPSPTHEEPHT